jgi:squalene cyclase
MRKSVLTSALFTLLSTINLSASAQVPEITTSLTWLNSSQTATGNWPGVETDEYYSTAAALDAVYALEPSSSAYTSALQWVSGQIVSPTDYLSRRIIALKRAGLDATSELESLLLYRNTSGSWGASEGFDGNVLDVLDTALALQALKAANYSGDSVLYHAVLFLINNQNADGGWGFYPSAGSGQALGDPSNVFVTAHVLKVLPAYQYYNCSGQGAVEKGVAYLLSKQNPDGGFGSSPSQVY